MDTISPIEYRCDLCHGDFGTDTMHLLMVPGGRTHQLCPVCHSLACEQSDVTIIEPQSLGTVGLLGTITCIGARAPGGRMERAGYRRQSRP